MEKALRRQVSGGECAEGEEEKAMFQTLENTNV